MNLLDYVAVSLLCMGGAVAVMAAFGRRCRRRTPDRLCPTCQSLDRSYRRLTGDLTPGRAVRLALVLAATGLFLGPVLLILTLSLWVPHRCRPVAPSRETTA